MHTQETRQKMSRSHFMAHRRKHPIPTDVPQLVSEFFELLHASGRMNKEVAADAKISRAAIGDWRTGQVPKLTNFDVALNALGYRLAIVRDE